MYDNFQIQFGREEFCLVTGLKFGVEYSDDYDDNDKPIPFTRRVFPSRLDGKRITGKDVVELIDINSFKKLDDDDAVSLCCIGILQLVLLGLEDRRPVPNWILRLANDRDGWDDYPWGSIVAWTSNKKFYRHMLRGFLHGRVPAEILIPDDVKARSGWWISSRAYFNGCVTEPERRPRHINRQNHYEVPSELYRDFQEQRSGLDQMMKQGQNIFKKMKKYMEDLNVGTGANREPIIADQHYGISDLSGFQSIQGRPSSFQSPTNNSIFNMCTPTNWQKSMPSQPGSSNWQSQIPTYTPTPMPSQPGSSNWQSQMPASMMHESPYTPLPATTELPKKRVGRTKKNSKNDNLSPLNLGNAFAHDNVGGDDVLITGEHDTGIYFTYENVDPNKVTRQEYNDFTDFILNPYEVYLDCYMMGYLVPAFFWRQLVPHLCMPRSHSEDNEGWLSRDQMNAWIEILVRSRRQDADWIVSKSGTTCVYANNVGGNHWVTGAVNLPYSVFMSLTLWKVRAQSYCWNIKLKLGRPLCVGHVPVVPHESERYWENIRYEMGELFYKCRCENTRYCGYD
ncbi:phospholipase-like protein [Tanacetum coccineum]